MPKEMLGEAYDADANPRCSYRREVLPPAACALSSWLKLGGICGSNHGASLREACSIRRYLVPLPINVANFPRMLIKVKTA